MAADEEFRLTWAAARVNRGYTQDEACRLMGIIKPTLINWEKGATEPRFSQAQRLARLYKVSLDLIK